MFWPIVLPIEITFWLFLVFVVAAIAFAMSSNRTTWKVACISIGLALVAFIPSCIGVGFVLDKFRFGHFHHAAFDDVNDFRIERYLPTKSQNIDLFKNYSGNGYRARYEILHVDLVQYVDDMWERDGQYSAISRSDLASKPEDFSKLNLTEFSDLEWTLHGQVDILHSPVERDGGGATYYHNRETGATLQRAAYW